MTTKKRTNYINNRDLLHEITISKENGQMSDKLARMLMLLCKRYATKGSFVNYTYNNDMQAAAMLSLVRTWQAFDPEKSQNPFAFYTQCIKYSFIQYLNQEKRQRDIRDEIIVQEGLSPSFNYQIENEGTSKRDSTLPLSVSTEQQSHIFAFDEENQTHD